MRGGVTRGRGFDPAASRELARGVHGHPLQSWRVTTLRPALEKEAGRWAPVGHADAGDFAKFARDFSRDSLQLSRNVQKSLETSSESSRLESSSDWSFELIYPEPPSRGGTQGRRVPQFHIF
jgi:hypothetical protein